MAEHGLVILTPLSFRTKTVVFVPIGKTCVNVVIVYFILYTHETCNVSILHLHVEDRVMCGLMIVASDYICVPGQPGVQADYRSHHRQMEGAKCVAVSCLSKGMCLLSYDSILIQLHTSMTRTALITLSLLIIILFSISGGTTVQVTVVRPTVSAFVNTLRTGDADLRFYITTVQDG